MASKKGRHLAERAAATTRQPQPARLAAEQARKPGYRVVPVSLYVPEADGAAARCRSAWISKI